VGFYRTSVDQTLVSMDNNYFQYQSGFLSEDAWQAYKEELSVYLEYPFWLIVWNWTKHQYRVEFQNVVDKLISEKDSES